MFRLQVDTPTIHRILELALLVVVGVTQDIDGFGVGQAHELMLKHKVQLADELHRFVFFLLALFFVLQAFAEELEVVHVVVQSILDQVFQHFLCQIHVVVDVVEGHFRLNHPELGQVAGSVGVLSTEGGSKSINLAQCCGGQFAFELT